MRTWCYTLAHTAATRYARAPRRKAGAPDEQTRLVLRVDRDMSWRDLAIAAADVTLSVHHRCHILVPHGAP